MTSSSMPSFPLRSSRISFSSCIVQSLILMTTGKSPANLSKDEAVSSMFSLMLLISPSINLSFLRE
ncbi:ORF331 [White spot syndrome virus]|nr:ORF331 [White spot syndrome virus]